MDREHQAAVVQKHRRRRSRRGAWFVCRRRWSKGLLAGLAYWFLRRAVCGFVGRGHGVCCAVAGRRLGARFDSGRRFTCFCRAKRCAALCCWSGVLVFVGTVDNILKPLLIGNRLGLPVLFLFFGILGGLALFGALGSFSARRCSRCCGRCSISIRKNTRTSSAREGNFSRLETTGDCEYID